MFKDTNELIRRAYDNAKAHGFHDEKRTSEHWLMLIVSEVSEMMEADRRGRYSDRRSFEGLSGDGAVFDGSIFERYIKDTVEDEMADVAIRIYDYMGVLGMKFTSNDLAFDMDKEFKEEFGGFSFTQKCYLMVKLATEGNGFENGVAKLHCMLCTLEAWAKDSGIDLRWHIGMKMKYNASRGVLHGKKY